MSVWRDGFVELLIGEQLVTYTVEASKIRQVEEFTENVYVGNPITYGLNDFGSSYTFVLRSSDGYIQAVKFGWLSRWEWEPPVNEHERKVFYAAFDTWMFINSLLPNDPQLNRPHPLLVARIQGLRPVSSESQ